MRQRLEYFRGRFKRAWLWLGVFALALGSPLGWAGTVRVAAWSFAAGAESSTGTEANLKGAAAALKKLNPDVILVEGVRDWAMCGALAQALQPAEYKVLVCSAFRQGAEGTATPSQVAILSKWNGYFSWSEPWRAEGVPGPMGGFAFAALQLGKERVGFFSTQTRGPAGALDGSSTAPAALTRQWKEALATFRSWVTNRLDAVVVASGDLVPDSKEADFTLHFLAAPLAQAVTVPGPGPEPEAIGRFTRVELAGDPTSLAGVVLNGPQAACELVLTPPKPKAATPLIPKVLAEASPPPEASSQPGKEAVHRVPTLPGEESPGGRRPSQAQPETASRTSGPSQPANAPATVASAPPFNAQSSTLNQRPLYFAGAAAAGLVVFIGFYAWRRRAYSRSARAFPGPAQLSNGVSSYTLAMNPPSLTQYGPSPASQAPLPQPLSQIEGSGNAPPPVEAWTSGPLLLQPSPQPEPFNRAHLLLHLSHWLKQKLVQKLIADRAGLLHTQQAAAVKLVSFEERLARIEQQLQEQNRAYEKRIGELNDELLAAKAENRELIRARIAQVKAEMESARVRLLAQAGTERHHQHE